MEGILRERERERERWFDKNEPYSNTKIRVLRIDDSIKIGIGDDVPNYIFEDAKKGLKFLDNKYDRKELGLFYDLAALNPLENDEDKF